MRRFATLLRSPFVFLLLVSTASQAATSYDFGDAPDTYKTRAGSFGPHRTASAALHFGRMVDAEADGQPSANADADDLDGTADDEDGYSPRPVVSGQLFSVRPRVTNRTGLPYFTACTLDTNGNGSFLEEEAISPVEQSAGAQPSFVLSVPATASVDTNGQTYLRCVVSSTVDLATEGIGEIEDYRLDVLPPGTSITFDDDHDVVGRGNWLTYIGEVVHSGATAVTHTLRVEFDQSALDPDTITWFCKPVDASSCVAGQPSGTVSSGRGPIDAIHLDLAPNSYVLLYMDASVRSDARDGDYDVTAILDGGQRTTDTNTIVSQLSVSVPALSPFSMAWLAAALLLVAVVRQVRRRRAT